MGDNNSKPVKPAEGINVEVVDLLAMTKLWAYDELRRHPIEKKGWNVFQKYYKCSDLDIVCHFDEVRIMQGLTEYEDFDDGEVSSTQVLKKSHFSNNTHVEQTQRFFGTNSIEARVKVILQNTICAGDQTKVKLLIPEEIVKETSQFGKQIQIKSTYGYEDKKEVDWKVDHLVRVPAYSDVSAEHVILERELAVWFKVPVTLLGNVNVIISDTKTSTVLKVFEVNIASIVNFNMDLEPEIEDTYGYNYIHKPRRHARHNQKGLDWDVAESLVNYEVRGQCRFRYGVEQLVKIGGSSQL